MPSEPCVSGQELVTDQRLCQSKSHQDSVLSALNQQRKDGVLCDVTLVAGDQKFHAHKAVLAACSDYFRAMFSLCMVESEADEVTLQGVTSVGLKHALDFAYTGQIILEPGVIQDVLSAGSHLQLLELLSLCSHYLIQELNSVNYLDLYRASDLFHLPVLEEAVVSFLVEHLCELQQSRLEEVLLLPYRLLRDVLMSDRLTSLNEEEIWHLVVCWLEHDCRYQYTKDLIQHVRYGLMDVAALHHVAHCHPLVQSSAAALVDEALEYHRATFAQPLRQTAHTKPRFQSLTLYIAGGRKREVSRVRELRYFNPAAQENVRVAGCSNWSELAPMPAGRSHHCVAVMGHFLFVAGGEVEHSTGRTCAVRTACRYDPRGNCWMEIASMKACREHFVLGALGQYLYAVGGRNELRQVLPTVERYCPKRNRWTFVQSFDCSLSCHAGSVADDLLWVSGGVTNTAQYQNRLMVYNPEQNQWLARSPMLQRRVYHVMAMARRQLYVLGGNDLDYNNDRILVRHIDSYDIDMDQWTRCTFSLLTGQNESGVAVHDDRIYVVGGYSIWTNEPLACIQVLDVSTEGKEEVFYGPTLPFASNGIATCFLPAPFFTCPNLQTLQVPHHRIGAV
ncbi:kelch-like protein 32 isoform X3 [Oncorhynchus tshawytscha]|uniref:BTB domain-containing protein n=1 Tax=Oncorhynchus tshawytscha TaxID=74940 RepID=A0A8C8EIK9_ONCTS|nr:kelch-like protein 32 isoform X3 [Oncorhynchus tshawytscha]